MACDSYPVLRIRTTPAELAGALAGAGTLGLAYALGRRYGLTRSNIAQALAPDNPAAGRAGQMAAEGVASTNQPKDPFPGAVPTDPKLQGLLRGFIRKTNDVATVDRILADVSSHIHGSADLRKQALDGWTRILHFGDRYGTDYARKKGQEFLTGLEREAKP